MGRVRLAWVRPRTRSSGLALGYRRIGIGIRIEDSQARTLQVKMITTTWLGDLT